MRVYYLVQNVRVEKSSCTSQEGVGNDVFGGNCVLAGKALVMRSNRSKFWSDFAPRSDKTV